MARKFEVAILTGLFTITVGCFSIPVIIYATSSQDAGTNDSLLKLTEHFDINECPQKVRLNNYIGYNCLHNYIARLYLARSIYIRMATHVHVSTQLVAIAIAI